MGALSIVLLILGILMLIEGSVAVFFTNTSRKTFKWFMRLFKEMESHIRTWGAIEILLAIALIIISQKV